MTRLRSYVAATAVAVSLVSPLTAQGTYAIRGGTVHTLAGAPIENGTVVIVDGRITAVGANVTIPAGAEIVNAAGRHVYPGLFDAVTQLGLTEIGSVPVTSDSRELGDYNPHLRAVTAVHPASEHIPVARANGITHTVTAPRGATGGFAGQASAIHLEGWTVEEMLIDASVAMVIQWPGLGQGRRRGGGGGRARQEERSFSQRKRRAEGRIEKLEDWLEAAGHYRDAVAAGVRTPRDLKMEALVPVVNRELPVLIMANAERDIRAAMEFGERNDIDIIIAGGNQAWKMADELAAAGTKLILGATQAMPTGADEGYDESYANPGVLHAAGVKFGFGTFGSANSRTLPYEAAMAVGYGLPQEAALRAVTINTAEIFGLDDQLGTIEVGKLANLIVTDGDPLSIQTQIEYLMIAGRPTSTDNKHRASYEKYRVRR